jgi:hypothetical protein
MDILKDIEKNFLKINIYDKNADNGKMNIIKKQISDYFKYKSDQNNIIMLKKQKYNEDYKNARELNNYNYELFLEEKRNLHNIFKQTKTLASLYEYLNYKNANYANIPDIYSYEYINFPEHEKREDRKDRKEQVTVAPSKKGIVCPEGKILNPKTNRCIKDPAAKKVKPVKKDSKKKDVVDKEPKKEADKAIVKIKECPEGKILNPKTNRCIKDVNYKPKPK